MKHRPVVCILDDDRERCLREERALDSAIKAKKLPVSGMSNYGGNHLARTGLTKYPAVDVEGIYYTPEVEGELSYERLCTFLDMLVRKGIIPGAEEELDNQK